MKNRLCPKKRETMTYTNFLQRIDKPIISLTGFGHSDFTDAPWRDLYDNTGGDVTDKQIIELLAQHDELFAAMTIFEDNEQCPTMENIINKNIEKYKAANDELNKANVRITYNTSQLTKRKINQLNVILDKPVKCPDNIVRTYREYYELINPHSKTTTDNYWKFDRLKYFKMNNAEQKIYEAKLKKGRTRKLLFIQNGRNYSTIVKKVVFDSIVIPLAEGSL